MLGYAYLRAGNDRALKQALDALMKRFVQSADATVSDFDVLTRGQFARLVMEAFADPRDIVRDTGRLRDEDGEYRAEISTLRVRDAFAWKDRFSENYFQPAKTLTL